MLIKKLKLLLKLLCTRIQSTVDCNNGLHGTISNGGSYRDNWIYDMMVSWKCLVFSWALLALSSAWYEVIIGLDGTFPSSCLLTCGLLKQKKLMLLLKLLCTHIQSTMDCNSELNDIFFMYNGSSRGNWICVVMVGWKCLVFSWTLVAMSMAWYKVTIG